MASRWRGFADRSGATALELALVFPALITLIMGIFYAGWAMYCGSEVRHAVELGSRVYIVNPSATLTDLKTAVSSKLVYVSMTGVTVNSTTQAVGAATNQHITWSYQTTLAIPFVPVQTLPFSGMIDVPLATP
jgi:Flp pilus assembly protein TadG